MPQTGRRKAFAMSETKRTHLFSAFSEDYFRTISPAGLRQRIGLCGLNYPGCWDTKLNPADGILYYAPSEASGRATHTRLVAYDYDSDSARICFKSEEIVLPMPRQMPVTKLHESLTFLPDGRIFCTTHTTDRAPQQPEWMPFAHHSHIWEGWPGSTMICYDPRTDAVENWGVPVPRETIYGATYDARHNAIYMIGFMRGHVYRFSIDTRRVLDLGKVAEVFCYRLHVGPDGHIYGCTKSGYLWRVNVDTQKIEDLNWRVPAYPGNYTNNTWYRYMSYANNVDDRTFIFTPVFADEIYTFDTRTLRVESLGRKAPFDDLVAELPTALGINEFSIDREGVLWYPLTVYQFQKSRDDHRLYALPDYLMRWDYLRGAEPECLGAIGTPGYLHGQTSACAIDKLRDRLFLVDSGGGKEGLSVLAIDLAQFRPRRHERGAVATDPRFYPRPMTPEQARAFHKRGKAIEEVTQDNPFYAFPIENVTPIRLWRHVPHTAIEESKVIGLVWDEAQVLHGLCGDRTRYCFTIRDRQLASFGPLDEAGPAYRDWLLDACDPARRPPLADPPPLPHVAGRQYLARPSAWIDWNGGRMIVGTRDGLLAIIKGRNVFALGNAAPYGPVRSLCTNPARTRLWGTAGDDEDMGTVFYYDDTVGLRQLGFLVYNIHGYFDGPSASNVLSSIAVSPDERMIAVGGADRIGAIHLATLN
jgi:hypothetical protein